MRKSKRDNVQLKGKHQMKMRKYNAEKNWNVSNNLGISAVQCSVFAQSYRKNGLKIKIFDILTTFVCFQHFPVSSASN